VSSKLFFNSVATQNSKLAKFKVDLYGRTNLGGTAVYGNIYVITRSGTLKGRQLYNHVQDSDMTTLTITNSGSNIGLLAFFLGIGTSSMGL